MKETWVQSLGWEDPPEEGMATHSGILAWKISWAQDWWGTVHGVARNQAQLRLNDDNKSFVYDLLFLLKV